MKSFKYACMYAGAFLAGICFTISAMSNDAMALALGFPCILLAAVAAILKED